MSARQTTHCDSGPWNKPYPRLEELTANDAVMIEIVERGKRFVDRGIPVLILGETGTGKELLARALHAYSTRRDAAFVALNCASIPDTLIESELFGYTRGAFSGALTAGMKGKLIQANGGTLLLDEIGDMPAAQQTRLLRALSEREVTPLGAASPTAINFQLICATHQDLSALVEEGCFRADLFYRIAVGVLRLPALRERSDLVKLIERITNEEADDQVDQVTFEADALGVLMSCEWPGNLRQLRAALRYACAVMKDSTIRVEDLPRELMNVRAFSAKQQRIGQTLSQIEDCVKPDRRDRLLEVLADKRWNISAAAKDLGICRSSLYRQLKSLGIPHVRDAGHELLKARENRALPIWGGPAIAN
ncbi:sigma-54-dependent Fis family transcriptional regulator [Paraburkholderia sp. GAS348]|uniref:sigma-54-dependent Fis family transcriptional regulator n=1 Tax=Paraburkholderia sp. GAS348 TaxID=3035132 RepID=UPI003D22A828